MDRWAAHEERFVKFSLLNGFIQRRGGLKTCSHPGQGKKAGAGKDQLVEMRFYIPGVTTKKEALDGDDAPRYAKLSILIRDILGSCLKS